MLRIFKGDDTDFADANRLRITIGTAVVLAGCRAEFSFLGVTRQIPDASTGTFEVAFTAAETAAMPLGVHCATIRVFDAQGRQRTTTNTLRIEVTDNVDMAYSGENAADVDGHLIVKGVVDDGYGVPADLPEDYTPDEMRTFLNRLAALLRNSMPVAATLLMLAFTPAMGAEVEYVRFGSMKANTSVVTNVDLSAKADVTNVYTKTEADARIVELAPVPDFSTNNAALVATIEAKAPPTDTSGKQDRLPYPTNAIPYSVITNAPAETDPTVPAWAKSETPPQTMTTNDVAAIVASATNHLAYRLELEPTNPDVLTVGYAAGADHAESALRADVAAAAEGLMDSYNYRTTAEILTKLDAATTTNDVLAMTAHLAAKSNTVISRIMISGGPGTFRASTNHYPVVYSNEVEGIVDAVDKYLPYATTEWGGREISGEVYFTDYLAADSFDTRLLYLPYGWDALKVYLESDDEQSLPEYLDERAEALTNGLASASSVAAAQSTANAASNTAAAVAGTVAAWETYWDGDEVRVTVTNYDSQVHLPSLYIEQKNDNTNTYRTVWDERTRWASNEVDMAELRSAMLELDNNKADRAWGNYDSTTGEYAPDGYTWVSSPKIAIAGGLAYQRTLTTAGAVWVLCSNGMVAESSGVSSNGFFRIKDDEGNTTFEIVRGNKRTVGAHASGITVTESGGVNTITIPYNVVSEAAPTLYGTTSLDGEWAQLSPSWLGQSGAWTGVVTSASAQYFIKAEYEVGGETYIRNNAPISVGGGIYCTDGIHKVRPVYNSGNITWEVVQ